MTREQAARVLKYLWIERDENAKLMQQLTTRFFERQDALRMGAAALRGPQPDPDTGLVPCGCGGKAKCLHHLTPDGDYAVKCGKCKIMTDWFNSPEDAIKAFNTAMRCAGESLEVEG